MHQNDSLACRFRTGDRPSGSFGPEVLVLYRNCDEARGVHELGVIARFRYNDLKEAAVVAAGAGPMEIEWWEGTVLTAAGTVLRSAKDDTVDQ